MFANILHTYLKAVTSPFLEIQTFYYNNYSFLVFFFNPRTQVQLWPVQVVTTQAPPAVYQFTLLYSENLEIKKNIKIGYTEFSRQIII